MYRDTAELLEMLVPLASLPPGTLVGTIARVSGNNNWGSLTNQHNDLRDRCQHLDARRHFIEPPGSGRTLDRETLTKAFEWAAENGAVLVFQNLHRLMRNESDGRHDGFGGALRPETCRKLVQFIRKYGVTVATVEPPSLFVQLDSVPSAGPEEAHRERTKRRMKSSPKKPGRRAGSVPPVLRRCCGTAAQCLWRRSAAS